MEEKTLEFIETLTIDEFKKRVNAHRVGPHHNDKTGKDSLCYFTKEDGKTVCNFARCTSEGIPTRPVISWVSDGKEEFWLLHRDVLEVEW